MPLPEEADTAEERQEYLRTLTARFDVLARRVADNHQEFRRIHWHREASHTGQEHELVERENALLGEASIVLARANGLLYSQLEDINRLLMAGTSRS